ncbi:MAG: energy-coupling factor ABC transporter ATP-binding protein [bacterium]|nr:energy-coupling factor ABC transporter ATP-binding protein [bacterium]
MISIQDITYSYRCDLRPEESVEENGIKQVNLRIRSGELIVIAGKSGCGKTTLSKCINGLIPHFEEGIFEGDVYLDGQNTKEMEIGKIGELVGSVFQDPRSQFFTTNVFDELSFGCRNMGMRRDEIISRMEDAIQRLNIEKLRDRSLLEMSSGEKQKVAIASCYCMKPRVFLFDEPSANLDMQAVEELRDLMERLKTLGHTIVVLEHRLYYLRDLMDYFAIMENGRLLKVYQGEEALSLSSASLQKLGLRLFYPEKLEQAVTHRKSSGEKGLEIRQLFFHYKNAEDMVFSNLNMTAEPGEIIAVTGNNGAGKSTLAKVITGLLKEQSGSVLWKGETLSPRQRTKYFYYVMQDSDYQLFSESVEKELLLGLDQSEKKKSQMEELLQYFGLHAYRNQHPMALSRGQKQRLTIAAALMSDARILILDEPSSGLDGESMRKMSDLLQQIAGMGRILLIISHDTEFIRTCCSRTVELREDGIYEM